MYKTKNKFMPKAENLETKDLLSTGFGSVLTPDIVNTRMFDYYIESRDRINKEMIMIFGGPPAAQLDPFFNSLPLPTEISGPTLMIEPLNPTVETFIPRSPKALMYFPIIEQLYRSNDRGN